MLWKMFPGFCGRGAFQNHINVRTSNLTATVPDVEVRSLLEADADAMIFQQE